MARRILEDKYTCRACGRSWFYGKRDITGTGSFLPVPQSQCCVCCVPLMTLPSRRRFNLNICPTCGSKSVLKEEIVHDV